MKEDKFKEWKAEERPPTEDSYVVLRAFILIMSVIICFAAVMGMLKALV